MSTKHTPGPWKLETVPTSIGCCHKIGIFPSLSPTKDNYACVYVDHRNPGERGLIADELLANARLMAASPELFIVCNMLIENARPVEFDDSVHEVRISSDMIQRIEALLNQIKGEE